MDIDYFKNKLEKLNQETIELIEDSKDSAKPVELDQSSVGRVSRIDAMQQQAMALANKQKREQLLVQIESAFKRIENGDFGYCTNCGEEIAAKRLDLNPTVLTCIKCASGK